MSQNPARKMRRAKAPKATEQPFSPALRRLCQVYLGQAQQAIIAAANEEAQARGLPDGWGINVERGAFVPPAPTPEPAPAAP